MGETPQYLQTIVQIGIVGTKLPSSGNWAKSPIHATSLWTHLHTKCLQISFQQHVPQPPNGIEAKPKTIYSVCHLYFPLSMTIKPPIHSLYLSWMPSRELNREEFKVDISIKSCGNDIFSDLMLK
jgi:hypothetical protein